MCIAFKTPVPEPWTACIHLVNSKALCFLQKDYRNAAGVPSGGFREGKGGANAPPFGG